MNRDEAIRLFRESVLPGVKSRETRPDYPARAEAWGVFLDGLQRNGRITMAQYESWSAPRECTSGRS